MENMTEEQMESISDKEWRAMGKKEDTLRELLEGKLISIKMYGASKIGYAQIEGRVWEIIRNTDGSVDIEIQDVE